MNRLITAHNTLLNLLLIISGASAVIKDDNRRKSAQEVAVREEKPSNG